MNLQEVAGMALSLKAFAALVIRAASPSAQAAAGKVLLHPNHDLGAVQMNHPYNLSCDVLKWSLVVVT